MPCSICNTNGHNIRTCQFKDGFIARVIPSTIKQKKQKSVFKDRNQMSLALIDHQQFCSDKKKLLENKDKQKIEIQKHLDHFPQDKQLLERIKDNTISNYNDGIPGFTTIYNIFSTDDRLFISLPTLTQMYQIKRFLKTRPIIKRKPKLPFRPSDININKNNMRIYNSKVRHYNREITKYKKKIEIVPTKLQSPKMTNNKLRLDRLLSMITQLSRIERAFELTDVIINHNRQSIIQPFKKKVEDIHTYTKHNRIVRLTKHYSDSLEHSTNLPDDMVRNVLSFLI
jgi:hypothetical protein